ncbi:MAG: transposase [Treponema sp.]|jgi:putative transposase|nr:transposase [Treponema sp.]
MRKNRLLQNGAEYHVTAKINRNEMLFAPEKDKELFLIILKRAKKRYQFQIRNFCLMNNHIHLLIKPGEGESLSAIMQWILSVFAMRWNKMHTMSGHVWGERFFSRIINGVVDSLRVFMYIDDNPVNARLIEHSWEWKHGGLWHHQKGWTDIVEKPGPFILYFLPEHSITADIIQKKY